MGSPSAAAVLRASRCVCLGRCSLPCPRVSSRLTTATATTRSAAFVQSLFVQSNATACVRLVYSEIYHATLQQAGRIAHRTCPSVPNLVCNSNPRRGAIVPPSRCVCRITVRSSRRSCCQLPIFILRSTSTSIIELTAAVSDLCLRFCSFALETGI